LWFMCLNIFEKRLDGSKMNLVTGDLSGR